MVAAISDGQLVALIAVLAFVVSLVPIFNRFSKTRRRRNLVWDEILGHEASRGVSFKPSITERVTTLSDGTDARFDTINKRLSRIELTGARAAGEAAHAAIVASETNAKAHEIYSEVRSINGQTSGQGIENLSDQIAQNPLTPKMEHHESRRNGETQNPGT